MKISVIVPVFNSEKYLKRCMDSLLSQSYSDWEILLIDDGSIDNSAALCDAYRAVPGVRVIHQENAGLGMARNRGLSEAAGDYVLFVDPDDYFGADLLKNLFFAAETANADLAAAGFTLVFPDGKQEARPYGDSLCLFSEEEIRHVVWNTVGSLPEDPLDSRYGMTACARLYRRRLLEEHRIRFVSERELISEDLIFNLRFLQYASRVVFLPDVSYFYCTNPLSLSKSRRTDRFLRDCELFVSVRKMLAESYEERDFLPYLQRLLISRARFDIMQEVAYHDQINPKSDFYGIVKKIAEEPLLQKALERYPLRKLPKAQGLFAFLLKRKQVRLLVFLARLRRIFT